MLQQKLILKVLKTITYDKLTVRNTIQTQIQNRWKSESKLY